MLEVADGENLEFKWGKKRGIGGKKKDVRFYESFTYDGVEYSLYDCVYLYSEGESEPYIGKLIKIWENADKTKKVKVLWFFRPCEISNFLGNYQTTKNELFLACGEGVGLTNVNPLEAIVGKCNVVCLSKDSRNAQPSDEQDRLSDFIFYCSFDVGHHKILDKIDEKIAGIEVKFIFNRVECRKSSIVPKLNLDKNEVGGNAIASDEKLTSTQHKILEKHITAGEVEVEEKVNSTKDTGELDNRPSKKAKLDNTRNVNDDMNKNGAQNLGFDYEGSVTKAMVATMTNEDKSKLKLAIEKDSNRIDKGSSKNPKGDLEFTKHTNVKLIKSSSIQTLNVGNNSDNEVWEVTRRPNLDRSKWFKELPWEERMRAAHEQGTLVLLENLDPSYTSMEIEDIIWHAFKENCSAKMVPRIVFSSPHSGQAYVIFKTRETAKMVVTKLDEGCLLLSNGRPLVGSIQAPYFIGKQSTFFGHLVIDKLKFHMQREMREAVSTSHCSQPNTLEYDMAIEWCLLRERFDCAWRKLYEQQGQELRKLKVKFKPRPKHK